MVPVPFNVIAYELGPDSVCVPLVPPSIRPATVMGAVMVTVYVPGTVIAAMSLIAGTTPPIHLVGSFQFPFPPTHAFVPPGTRTLNGLLVVPLGPATADAASV